MIDVSGDLLIATMPGSSFHASYMQRDDMLVQTTAMQTDIHSSTPRREFEDLAWEAANCKARSIGWIK